MICSEYRGTLAVFSVEICHSGDQNVSLFKLCSLLVKCIPCTSDINHTLDLVLYDLAPLCKSIFVYNKATVHFL